MDLGCSLEFPFGHVTSDIIKKVGFILQPATRGQAEQSRGAGCRTCTWCSTWNVLASLLGLSHPPSLAKLLLNVLTLAFSWPLILVFLANAATVTASLRSDVCLSVWQQHHRFQSGLTGVLHGRPHHQEGHGDADGYEDLDQLGHPGVRPVMFINNLHGLVGRAMGECGCWKWRNKEESSFCTPNLNS